VTFSSEIILGLVYFNCHRVLAFFNLRHVKLIVNNNNNDDIVWRALGSASISATKEPPGLVRQDGKWPDRLTLIPWEGGKSLTWDVTVVSTLAQGSYCRCGNGGRVGSRTKV